MSPEDLDKAAEALRGAYYKGTLWGNCREIPLVSIVNDLLANPNHICGAFVWESASEEIREKGVHWKWSWFSEYDCLSHGAVISKGASWVMEVLKRLRVPQKNVNLEDYM